MYDIEFDYRRLRDDLGLPLSAIAGLFKKHFNVTIQANSVCSWFRRGAMPVERLTQLIAIVRLETNRRLDIWRYVRCRKRGMAA